MHNLKKILVVLAFLVNLLFAKPNIFFVKADTSNYNETFIQEFNDLSEVDISYSKGNNTTFISQSLEYYSSSFSFNSVTKELQFGRNTHATKNIGETDELYMCFDLGGHIDNISFDLGTINTNNKGNINLKVEYSLDKGNTWNSYLDSEKEVTSNSIYEVKINKDYDIVRFKLVMSNVNNIAGKNVVIKSLKLTGNKIYPYAVSDLMNSIDNCNCETFKDQYLNLSNKYDNLSAYDKNIFDNALTSDNETTYLERLQYIINLCKSIEEQNNNINNNTKNTNEDKTHYIILMSIIAALACIGIITSFVISKKKR